LLNLLRDLLISGDSAFFIKASLEALAAASKACFKIGTLFVASANLEKKTVELFKLAILSTISPNTSANCFAYFLIL